MVGVVKSAVDGRDALLCLSTIAPELRHVDFARFIVPARVIRDDLLALVADVFHHHRNEIRIGKLNLVGSYMEIRYIKSSAYLIDDIFQNLRALLALHIGLEGTLKGSTMSRHIDFRNQEHLVLLAEFHQLAGLIQGIELTLLALHVFRRIELRIFPAFQSPSLVFCEMPVENIDLVSAEQTDFTFQFLYRNIASAHIVHEAADAEGRPVGDVTLWQIYLFILSGFQLFQRLSSPIHTLWGGSLQKDLLGSDGKMVSLFLEFSSFNLAHIFFLHCQLAAEFLAVELILLRQRQQ